ncbi:MAG: hypothetical protein P8104_06130 [Gammaproteobacteria bacterium]
MYDSEQAPAWQLLDLSNYRQGAVPDQEELARLSGILDPVNPLEVVTVFNPWVDHVAHTLQAAFAAERCVVIGMTGSVCSGKTTAARVLHYLFAQRYGQDKTTLLTLDHFLKPNALIQSSDGGMESKGFPETFRFDDLLCALNSITRGQSIDIPTYDHARYDICFDLIKHIPPNQKVLILEGIIAAQDTPPWANVEHTEHRQHVRDFCDTLIFVKTPNDNAILPAWFEERLLLFARTARQLREGHLAVRYAEYIEQYDQDRAQGVDAYRADERFTQAIRQDAQRIWRETNGPNYDQYILPSKAHCDTILLKNHNHHVAGVFARTGIATDM